MSKVQYSADTEVRYLPYYASKHMATISYMLNKPMMFITAREFAETSINRLFSRIGCLLDRLQEIALIQSRIISDLSLWKDDEAEYRDEKIKDALNILGDSELDIIRNPELKQDEKNENIFKMFMANVLSKIGITTIQELADISIEQYQQLFDLDGGCAVTLGDILKMESIRFDLTKFYKGLHSEYRLIASVDRQLYYADIAESLESALRSTWDYTMRVGNSNVRFDVDNILETMDSLALEVVLGCIVGTVKEKFVGIFDQDRVITVMCVDKENTDDIYVTVTHSEENQKLSLEYTMGIPAIKGLDGLLAFKGTSLLLEW